MTPSDEESYEFREILREDLLADEEFRSRYAESYLNSYVAAQIKTLREQRGMTQAELAERIGSKQAGVSRLENVNYSAWKTETLRRIARALGVRLRISFETYGSLLDEVDEFSQEQLQRPGPEADSGLQEKSALPRPAVRRQARQRRRSVADVSPTKEAPPGKGKVRGKKK